jgi:hypothetical protein
MYVIIFQSNYFEDYVKKSILLYDMAMVSSRVGLKNMLVDKSKYINIGANQLPEAILEHALSIFEVPEIL